MKLFGDGRSANDGAALENERLRAFLRKVERGDEGIMPAAENHDVALCRHLFLPRVFQNFESSETSGCAHDAAAGVRRRTAHVQFADRSSIASPTGNRPQKEKLFERKFALKNIAFGKAS